MATAVEETARAQELRAAQAQAVELFAAIEQAAILVPGVTESEASDAIRELATRRFGVLQHWHKRIVRAGSNTVLPYAANPPERRIQADDIAFLDLGPVFAAWEADFGRTFVLGDDPVKARLRDALAPLFEAGRRYFESDPDITGEQLYAEVVRLAHQAGWDYGGPLAGHLVGEFPHDRIPHDKVTCYVAPGSSAPMRRLDQHGRVCHWILEIHLVDRARGIGGFYEQLLDL